MFKISKKVVLTCHSRRRETNVNTSYNNCFHHKIINKAKSFLRKDIIYA